MRGKKGMGALVLCFDGTRMEREMDGYIGSHFCGFMYMDWILLEDYVATFCP